MLLRITNECFVELGQRDQQVLVARELLHLPYERVADMLQLSDDQRTNIDYVYYEASVMLGALHDEVGDESPQVWQRGSAQAID
ncbi:MAG: hypothetical protein IH807_11435, partial [Proteobacteria bacterium]|nr:hypothetical protein [Pseudomonadota bacterium]